MKFLLTHEGRGGGSNSMHFDRTKDLETPLSLSLIFQSFYFVCCWESVPELSGWKKRAMGKRVPSVPAHTQTAHPDGGTWMVAVCVCEFNKYYYTVRSILEDTCYLYSHIVRPWWYFHIYKVMCASRMLKGWWGEENYYFILEMCTSELLW